MAQSFDPSAVAVAVLVVEDEPLLLWDAVDMIEEAGFKAYGPANADEALRMLERHSEISVLFTDVDMPLSMNGLKLARMVRDRWPPVSIIVASGHVKVSRQDLPENGLFFSKPYPSKAVVSALNDIAAGIAS